MNIDILQILIIQLFSLYLIFLNKGYKGDDTYILSTLTIIFIINIDNMSIDICF